MRIWCAGQLDWEGLACYVVAINFLRGHFVHCCSPRKFSVIGHLRHQVKLNWTLVSFDAHTPMTTILWVVVTYQSCELKTHALFPVLIKWMWPSMLISPYPFGLNVYELMSCTLLMNFWVLLYLKHMWMCSMSRISPSWARAGCKKTLCLLHYPRKIKFIHSFIHSFISMWCGGVEGERTLFHSLHTVRRKA